MTINTEFIRNTWIPALRSGKYKQSSGFLRDRNNYYCCLGVACQLAVQEGVLNEPEIDADHNAYGYGASLNISTLPYAMTAFLGGVSSLGNIRIPDLEGNNYQVVVSLSQLNDHFGYSFNDIADVLEKIIDPNEPDYEFVGV